MKKKGGKRKNSSDGSSTVSKSAKNGGDGGDCVDVSETIARANSVLLDISVGAMDNSVFEPATVSTGSKDSVDSVGQDKPVISAEVTSAGGSGSPTNADIMKAIASMHLQINERITCMDKKLEKLDKLEQSVCSFEKDLKKLWTQVHDNKKSTDESISKVTERADTLEYSVGVVHDSITQLKEENSRLKDSLVYVQSQSMRNNLLFSGIPEDVGEKPDGTETKLRGFLVEKLKLAQDYVDRLQFERVHRTGDSTQASGGRRPQHRNIVAKFAFFKDREEVRRSRVHLKGSNYFVNEQFPKEVVEKRKRLFPKMKKARDEGKTAWVSYDTLYVNGRPQRDTQQ